MIDLIDFLAGVLVGAGGVGVVAVELNRRRRFGRRQLMTDHELRRAEIDAGLRPAEFQGMNGRVYTRDPNTGKVRPVDD